jgi:hypothetical protein
MEEALEVRSGPFNRILNDDPPHWASAIRAGGRRFHELSRRFYKRSLKELVPANGELVHTLAKVKLDAPITATKSADR